MSKLLILGDVHWKFSPESPYNKGLEKLFKYLFEKYFDHDIIQTGDYFDVSSVHWDTHRIASSFLKNHSKQVFILTGNHDRSSSKGNSLVSLSLLKNVTILQRYDLFKVNEYLVSFYPYLNSAEEIKKTYSDLKSNDVDLSISHTSPPGQNFGSSDEIEFKFKPRIAHVYGHIHNFNVFKNEFGEHIILGVPQTTRNGEQAFKKHLMIVENGVHKFEEVPIYFDIEDVTYGDQPKSKSNLLNIIDCPSVESALNKYQDYNVRRTGIKLLRTKIQTEKTEKKQLSDKILEKFSKYCEENEVSQEEKIVGLHYLNEALINVNNSRSE